MASMRIGCGGFLLGLLLSRLLGHRHLMALVLGKRGGAAGEGNGRDSGFEGDFHRLLSSN
jgi:hypothetical protein